MSASTSMAIRTSLCRARLQAQAAAQLVQTEQELEAQRQTRITQQQHKAQHAKRVTAAAVRKVPQQAQQKRLATLKELQDLVDQRYAVFHIHSIGFQTNNYCKYIIAGCNKFAWHAYRESICLYGNQAVLFCKQTMLCSFSPACLRQLR